MKKTKLETASDIAFAVYEMQYESDFFYEITSHYGIEIPNEFSEKVLEHKPFKEVILMKMTANILMDLNSDSSFIKNHTDEEGHVGYHPDDIAYDEEMTRFIMDAFDSHELQKSLIKPVMLPKEYYANQINLSLVEKGSRVRLFPTENGSIEIKLVEDPFIKSSMLNLSDDFYKFIEASFERLGMKERVSFNNTRDIFCYWIDSNTRAWL